MKRRWKKPPPAVTGARWIPLTKGKFALVDVKDYEAVMLVGPWHLYTPSRGRGKRKRKTHYARKVFYLTGRVDSGMIEKRRISIYLHRWLWAFWGLPPAEHVDHVDGDGLDCRRSKLRAATHTTNQHNRLVENSTGYTGVKSVGGGFVARITVKGNRCTLGKFATAEAAARAYDASARWHRGEFARLNFPVTP